MDHSENAVRMHFAVQVGSSKFGSRPLPVEARSPQEQQRAPPSSHTNNKRRTDPFAAAGAAAEGCGHAPLSILRTESSFTAKAAGERSTLSCLLFGFGVHMAVRSIHQRNSATLSKPLLLTNATSSKKTRKKKRKITTTHTNKKERNTKARNLRTREAFPQLSPFDVFGVSE